MYVEKFHYIYQLIKQSKMKLVNVRIKFMEIAFFHRCSSSLETSFFPIGLFLTS